MESQAPSKHTEIKNVFPSIKKTLNIKGILLDLETPAVMGVMNITPDSFFSGSRHSNDKTIVNAVSSMIEQGAKIIDIGGHSTRPGAGKVSIQQEMDRVIPVIELIVNEIPCVLSIDTYRSSVAEIAINSGASIINDISGGQLDQKMFQTVAGLQVPYIVGHMKGNFETMMTETDYDDLIGEIVDFFASKINQLKNLGVIDIVIDPGFGFSKTLDQNYELLKNLAYFSNLGIPVMAGVSRKSMIYDFLEKSPEGALNGTTVLNTIALQNGASILRVHDVTEANEAIKLYKKINS